MTVPPGARNGENELSERVAAALALAEIPPSKLGPARRARLTDAEGEVYVWILRRFATEGRPSRVEVRAAAERLGLDAERALESLAREDLVRRGSDGEIAVAYPFSGRPTAHRVRFPGGHEVDAMCAIDALGIAPMFGEPEPAVLSVDPRLLERGREHTNRGFLRVVEGRGVDGKGGGDRAPSRVESVFGSPEPRPPARSPLRPGPPCPPPSCSPLASGFGA